MNETEALVKRIAEGIQEKKGRDIVVANLTATDNTVCKYFVICEGNTPTQVAAIADSVSDYVRIHASEKPIHVEGMRVARWVAMDYSDVMVHVFVPEERDFYNLENLLFLDNLFYNNIGVGIMGNLRVQSDRFVSEQNIGIVNKCSRNRNSLHLTARHLIWFLV